MLVIDRIEGRYAVCELPGREMKQVPLAELPDGAGEGDCLRLVDGRYEVDAGETARRRAQNRALFERLARREKP